MKDFIICYCIGISLLIFSCSTTTSKPFSTVPRQLQPSQQGRVWKDGQVQLTDTAKNVYAAVKSAWQHPKKNIFTLYIENRGTSNIELDPDKFYTLNRLTNGENMGAYAFPAAYLMALQKPPVRKPAVSADIVLLLAPFWIAGTIAEIEQISMMSPEERRVYEMQQNLERIDEHLQRQHEEKLAAQQRAEDLANADIYSRSLLRKHTLKPGEKLEGDVAFPVISGIDSIWLIVPLSSSDTLKFCYRIP